MYWLIEDIKNIETLTRIQLKEAYVEVIPYSYNVHPMENEISLVYIKPLDGNKGYIISINHSEALQNDINQIQNLIDSIEKIYVIDKKEFLHYLFHKNIISLNLIDNKFEKGSTTTHNYFYNKYPNQIDINTIIPIVKHYELCEINFQLLTNCFGKKINKFYNNKATVVFNVIESVGIKVDPTLFNSYFNKNTQGYVYTQYKLNTTTTRPSNKFDGINFSALNKENNERTCFIPNNDFFIDMDISAYHPNLLANIVGYTFPNTDIHGAFAEMYGVDYAQAKEITFKQIYGGIWEKYEHLEFFQKVKTLTQELWNQFISEGYIECPISHHKFEKDQLEDMNPQKLLNYFCQNLETSTNILIMWDILKILRGKNTKLILYVYDSFLLDVDKSEKDTIKQIIDMFKKYNLQLKFKKGINYNFT